MSREVNVVSVPPPFPRWAWPPILPDLADTLKQYYLDGRPLSIAGRTGTVYEELEDEFARLHGRKHALLVSSGTMALYSAYFALGLGPGDEVVCTAYSYHATAAPLLHLGVKVVFCDVEPDTGNIAVDQIEGLITTRTRAVVTNDQWGHPVNKDAVLAVCRKHSLAYIEDCSHAHFSSYRGAYVGTFGNVACWSLQGSKLLSGGEGGILLTDDRTIYEKAVLLGHNLKRPFEEVHAPEYMAYRRTGFGLKLRIHPLAAVMILHQLRHHCFDWIHSRAETLGYFQSQLAAATPLLPMARRDYATSMGAWYGFKPRADFQALGIDRARLAEEMSRRGFEVDIPGSDPLPSYQLFQAGIPGKHASDPKATSGIWRDRFPGAAAYSDSILSLPTFTFPEDRPTINRYVHAFTECLAAERTR